MSGTERTIGDPNDGVRVQTISQVYETGQADLWVAVTTPDRIRRWFLPVEGDLKEGGHYQLQGNAGGTITRCDPPSSFAATWEFGGDTSRIEVRLTLQGIDRTLFELDHTARVDNDFWDTYGPGATGIGWELALRALSLQLSTSLIKEEASPEGHAFIRAGSDAWARAAIAAGEDPAASRERADRVCNFYTGQG